MPIKLNKYYLNLILLLSITIFLSIPHQYELVNIFYVIFCAGLLIFNHRILYFIYFVFLPTNGLISTEYNLFGILHTSYVINLFTTIALILDYKYLKSEIKKYRRGIGLFSKPSISFIIFITFYLLANNFKDFFLSIDPQLDLMLLITRTIKLIILFFPLYCFSFLSILPRYRKIIFLGFSVSTILIGISAIFSFELINLGLHTAEERKDIFLIFGENYIRRSGVFSFGDENSVAGFLSIGLSVLLYITARNEKYLMKLLTLIVAPIAIMVTGSRAGFICFFISISFFVFQQKGFTYKAIITVISMFIINTLYLAGLFDPILERFLDIDGMFDSASVGGRLGGWIFYINYIVSDITIILFGSWDSIYDATRTYTSYNRVAHNFFITLIYKWGIFPLIYFIYLFKKIITISWNGRIFIPMLSIILQSLIMLFTLSDTGVFFALIPALILLEQTQQGIFNEE